MGLVSIALCVIGVMEAMWLSAEMLTVSHVQETRAALVLGAGSSVVEKLYVYLGAGATPLFLASRYGLIKLYQDREEQKRRRKCFLVALAFLLAGLLLYEVPVCVLAFLVIDCRKNYLTSVQIASRLLHAAVAFTRAALLFKLSSRARTSPPVTKTGTCLVYSSLATYFSGVICIFALAGSVLSSGQMMSKYDPELKSVSLFILPAGSVPATGHFSKHPVGQHLADRGSRLEKHLLVQSLADVTVPVPIHVRMLQRYGAYNPRRWESLQERLTMTLDCEELPSALRPPWCDGELQVVFRYDIPETSQADYGKLSYRCAVTRNATCTEGCGTWQIWPLKVDTWGNNSLVSTPWQEVTKCGVESLPRDANVAPCSSSAAYSYSIWSLVAMVGITRICL